MYNYHNIVRYITFIGLILSLSTTVSAQSVVSTEYGDGYQIQHFDDGRTTYSNHQTYLRWDGVWIPAEWLNINNYNWTYEVLSNNDTYVLKRMDDTLILPKNFGNYHFGLNKISFDFTVTPAQLNARSTQVGANWYIEIPEALVKTRFLWDDKKPTITNNTGLTLNETDYWYVRYNGKYYLGYNQAARTWGTSSNYITFTFNSWTVGEGGNAWSGNSSYSNFMLDRNTNHIILPNTVTDGLVLYQKMSGSSGITSYDMNLTSNNNGTLIGMNIGLDNGTSGWNSSGKFGNALSFDGVNDYVNAGNGTSLAIYGDITISLWIYIQNYNQYQFLVQKQQSGGTNNQYEFRITQTSGVLLLSRANTTSLGYVFSSASPPTNKWSHLTVSQLGPKVSFYINGLYRGGGNISVVPTGGGSCLIGTRSDLYTYFNGLIDDVRIYNRALTNDEINQTMNNTMVTSDNLTTWYDAGTVNETYQIDINATSQTNANYSAFYRTNGTGAWTQIGTPNSTGNQSISLSTKYQNTDLKIELYGNGTATSDIIKTTFWTQTASVANPPIISSWGNNYTDDSQTTFSVAKNTNITFNATANQTITTWNWIGATQINGTSSTDSYAYYNFLTSGIYSITVNGTNDNGVTNTTTWTITVGLNNLTLSGYVNNTLGYNLTGVRVDLSSNHTYTDTDGYYNLTNISDGDYSVLFRQIGYNNYTSNLYISDNTMYNITLESTLINQSTFDVLESDVQDIYPIAIIGFIGFMFGILSMKRRR